MNRVELFQAGSPSIRSINQPCYRVVPHTQIALPFLDNKRLDNKRLDRKNVEYSRQDRMGVTAIDAPITLKTNARPCTYLSGNNTIAPASIADFLTLSRKFLGLDQDG